MAFAEHLANVVIHGSEPGGISRSFERFEIQLGQVHTIPVEALDESFYTLRYGLETIAIAQVHKLPPIQLRVLQDGGLFAPPRMVVPELLAHVRQFKPGVD